VPQQPAQLAIWLPADWLLHPVQALHSKTAARRL
jgi:hypothetical protein